MAQWQWILTQFSRRLWVRASLIGFLGAAGAVVAAFVEPYVPWELPQSIGADAVDSLLDIIASSMLAVTTFSLSVMVSAYGSATSNVTPRATRLLIEDRVSQNVLSTFLGCFLFGIVGMIALKLSFYGERGRVVLFLITIGIVILIVITLLRWIDHLTRLGRVGETTDRVEQATRIAIEERRKAPCLGGRPLDEAPRPLHDARAVGADLIGYVQHIDMPALSRCCEARQVDILVLALPGTFTYPTTALARISPRKDAPTDEGDADMDGLMHEVRGAFTIASERSFDQDPRFGLAVLSEIAMRALSPAVNDPGTAIDVLGRATRLLALWAEPVEATEPQFPQLFVAPLAANDLMEDAFMLIARDGAALIEVQLRLQKSLNALAQLGDSDFRAAARRQASMARQRAEAALTLDEDKRRLREVHADIEGRPAAPLS